MGRDERGRNARDLIPSSLASVGTDVAHAWRYALRRPGFALAVVLTLGLGIGANTAIFSMFHTVVLSPLPYENSQELFGLSELHTSGRTRVPSYPTFQDWRSAEGDVFDGIAFARGAPVAYQAEDHSGFLLGAFVTDGFFELMGVPAELGRVLTTDDYRPDTERAVLLSHRAWNRWFGSDSEILGTVLRVDEQAFTVVGVMPPSFAYPDWGADNDMWIPISQLPVDEIAALNQRGFHADSRVVARIRDGGSVSAARQRMDVLAEALAATYPDLSAQWTSVQMESLRDLESRGARSRLLLLWASALLVLLMCCLNLANLYLVQGSSRRLEYSIRATLGAPRGRVFRQIVTETLFLTLAAGLLGVLLAHQSIAWMRSGGFVDLPRITELELDSTALAFAAFLSTGTALVFARLSNRHMRGASLKENLRGGAVGSRRTASVLSGVQAVQVGTTFALLLGAWLLGETFWKLSQVDPGYDPRNVVVIPIQPPSPAYDEEESAVALYSRLIETLASVPGVISVALTNHGPGGTAGAPTPVAIGRPPDSGDEDLSSYYRTVSPGYFAGLNHRVVAGREFTEDDLRGGDGPVIINETLATRLGDAETAIGRTIGVRKAASTRADFGEPLLGRIVGVVADLDVSETGGAPRPMVYVPYSHTPWAQARLLVRTTDASASTMRALEAGVRSVEPAIPLSGPFVSVQRLEDLRSSQRADERLNAGLLAGFAAVALALACIGMYGVISFTVTLRQREIGLRMALGDTSRGVATNIVLRAGMISAIGLAVGALVAANLSSFVASSLFDVNPLDVKRYAIVAILLLVLAALAAYVPARRASQLDPAMVLRSE